MTNLISNCRRAAVAVTLVAASVAGISTTAQAAQQSPPERSAAGLLEAVIPTFPTPATAGTTSCTMTSTSATRRRRTPLCSWGS
jgi:hypothetical protein